MVQPAAVSPVHFRGRAVLTPATPTAENSGDVFISSGYEARPAASPVARARVAESNSPVYRPEAMVEVLEAVSRQVADGLVPVVVFDLDDTLLDTTPRVRQVLHDFAAQEWIEQRFPAETERIRKNLGQDTFPYRLEDVLQEMGVENRELLEELGEFFGEHFFSEEYLKLDRANSGAVEFVREVVERGGQAVYYTGRWEDMRRGSELGLQGNGFPSPDGESVRLVMKPSRGMDDEAFKRSSAGSIAALGPVVGGFENEPANANLFREAFPQATIVLLDTRHSGPRDPRTGRPLEVHRDIARVPNFRLPGAPGVPRAVPALERQATARDHRTDATVVEVSRAGALEQHGEWLMLG